MVKSRGMPGVMADIFGLKINVIELYMQKLKGGLVWKGVPCNQQVFVLKIDQVKAFQMHWYGGQRAYLSRAPLSTTNPILPTQPSLLINCS